MDGTLTIKNVSRPVQLAVEYGGMATDQWGNRKAGFEVATVIKRKDFGLVWDAVTEAGGVVGNDIKIHGRVQLVRQEA